jgi:hypothetical protein
LLNFFLLFYVKTEVCSACLSPRPKEEATAEGEEEQEEEEEAADPMAVDEEETGSSSSSASDLALVFGQLRSRALKALTFLLRNSESCATLFREGAFGTLLKMAVRPTELDEFRSLVQLEGKENRLWELIYQSKFSIFDPTIQKQANQLEVLKFHPLSSLPVNLPLSIDRGSAKRLKFLTKDLNTIQWNAEKPNEIAIGRANSVIPSSSIPVYYFEIKLVQREGAPVNIEGG